ncbi:MAG: RNA polymerase sigma factor [Solirubrobacteraceae bacterium]
MIAPPPACRTDAQLVADFRSGDDAAFSEMDRRYRAALTAFAQRMLLGSGHDADDVVQDALIRASRALRATDRPMTLRPWLYMIVRNRALDELRSPQRSDSYDDTIAMHAVPDADPAQCFAERDEVRRIVAEIGRLPERQRMALVMREFDGRSHAETAHALHTSVPATKSLIVRARGNLRAAVQAA